MLNAAKMVHTFGTRSLGVPGGPGSEFSFIVLAQSSIVAGWSARIGLFLRLVPVRSNPVILPDCFSYKKTTKDRPESLLLRADS